MTLNDETLRDLKSLSREEAVDVYNEILDHHDEEAMRILCRNDRFFLVGCMMMRTDVLENDWCFERCREIEAAPYGYLDLWSRFHYKSTLITLGGSVQEILVDPEITNCILSYNKASAFGFVNQIKTELERPELFRLFPEILWEKPPKTHWSVQHGLWVKRTTNPKEPTLMGSGLVDGQPTGKHYQKLTFDDVVVRESVSNKEMIAKTTKAWEHSLALGTDKGCRVAYVGTRYHPNDTYSHILSRGTIKERRRLCMDEAGNPTMMTREALEEIRRNMGPNTFSAQMLQDPVSEGVRTFKDEWLLDCIYTKAPPRDTMNAYLFVDGANSKRSGADFTTMLLLGLGEDGNIYWLDGEHGRMDLNERTDRLFRLHRKWNPQQVFYEQVGAMSDVSHIQYVMNEVENYRFPINRLARGPNDNKRRRIENLQAPFSQHKIWIPQYGKLIKSYTNAEGATEVRDIVQDFVEGEYQTYPNARHDDMLDTFADIMDAAVVKLLKWPKARTQGRAYTRNESKKAASEDLFAR